MIRNDEEVRGHIRRALVEHLSLQSTESADALDLDSLQALELLVLLDELAGHEVPFEVVAQLTTIGDLVELVLLYGSRASVDPAEQARGAYGS